MGTEYAKEMLKFIDENPSCFHVINNACSFLSDSIQLSEKDEWTLTAGKSYYVTRNDSSIIAFSIPKNEYKSFRISAAHSDSPCFKLKPNSTVADSNYTKLNVEKYGGMIMSTWFDRPLSVAGRVIVKSDNTLISKLINFDKDMLVIPNLAIHMNREINDGYRYNAQTDMQPLFGSSDERDDFLRLIAEQASCAPEDILGSDLFVYNRTKGTNWGCNDEYVSSRSLDDLMCAWSLIKGYKDSLDTMIKSPDASSCNSINVCCIFDNEEVGSTTKQGADSTFLYDVLTRINDALGYGLQKFHAALASSFMISADNGHAIHPNHPEKADKDNSPKMNNGVVIKYNAAQKYTTDAYSEAMFKNICTRVNVPYQVYANRSDIAGGSTLGNISNSHISVSTVDIGLAQLAMHSSYETAGALDIEYLVKAITEYYSSTEL